MSRVHLLQPFPECGLPHGGRAGQVAAGQLPAELEPLRRRPGRRVHAVGDRADRHFRRVEAGPQLVEHLPADPAVQQRDPVGALREPQAHMGHVEFRRVVFGPERDDAVQRNAGQQPRGSARRAALAAAEVALHHLHRKPVDACGDRGMRGEHGGRPHHGQRGVEIEPGVDQLADPLDAEEAGVTLVHVEHLGRRQPLDLGERPDRPHAADTGQDLLLDPVLLVAAVEPVGDAAQFVLVLRDVGIQQQQRDSTDLCDPHPGPQLGGVGHGQLHQHRVAFAVGEQPQRQALRIQRRVVLLLPAVGGQRLAEVTRPVVQTDRDQRQPQVRRRLQMVTGQDSQAAGVVRQHLGDAELHREVRDAVRHLGAVGGAFLVPQRPTQVVVELGGDMVQPPDERLVDCEFVQPFRAHLAEQRHRIAADLRPQRRIDGREQVLRRLVPRPAEVDGQPLQRDAVAREDARGP